MQNLKEVLELSGSSLEQVVKYNGESTCPSLAWLPSDSACASGTRVYLADMKDFAAMNEVYIEVRIVSR